MTVRHAAQSNTPPRSVHASAAPGSASRRTRRARRRRLGRRRREGRPGALDAGPACQLAAHAVARAVPFLGPQVRHVPRDVVRRPVLQVHRPHVAVHYVSKARREASGEAAPPTLAQCATQQPAGARTVLRHRMRVPSRPQRRLHRQLRVAAAQRLQVARHELAAREVAKARVRVSRWRCGGARGRGAQSVMRTARRGCCPSARSS